MLSRNLRQTQPPFFVRQKVQISSNIVPPIPNFANLVNFSSKINIFVTTASLRHFVSFSSKKILCSLIIVSTENKTSNENNRPTVRRHREQQP